MLSKIRIASIASIASIAAIAITVVVLLFMQFSGAQRYSLSACRGIALQTEQNECIFRIIEDAYKTDGITEAGMVFSDAYEHFDSFVSAGCHRHAHRVGDLAYFYEYLHTQDLDLIDFPQSTTACGYGFFHGFFEHLIQDHPTSEFVNETCEYMKTRLGSSMTEIGTTCYHGSGHGLSLAEGERAPKETWGNVKAFTERPLNLCEGMPNATDAEILDCKEGVFNILVEWMAQKQYGFELEEGDIFAPCKTVDADDRDACYYEMSQKVDSYATLDPVRVYELLKDAPKSALERSLYIGFAGIIQQTIAGDRPFQEMLQKCDGLEQDIFNLCMRSVVGGMFEHGAPQKEHELALTVCENPIVSKRGLQDSCYERWVSGIYRFHPPADAIRLCEMLPEANVAMCKGKAREFTK